MISDNAGKPTYRLSLDGKPMLTESALGLRTTMGDFTQGLAITDSKTETIEKQYDILNIKTSHINYKANSLTLALENQKKHKIMVTFIVSDNDVAFRYSLPLPNGGKPRTLVLSEASSFNFPAPQHSFHLRLVLVQAGHRQSQATRRSISLMLP